MTADNLGFAIAFGLALGAVGCAAGGGDDAGDDVNGGTASLIDDLEDGDDAIAEEGGRLGGWYTFHDDTAGGTQTPSEESFTPTAGGAGDSAYAAQTTGGGFTEWGAGMGFDLNNPSAVGEAGDRAAYDTSGYRSLAFKARGSVPIRVALETLAVTPTDRGGACTPSTTEGQECEDLHGANFTLTSEWKDYEVTFAQLRQEGWGKAEAFDATQVTSVLFQVGAGVDFDIAIDDVRFYE